jgi:hypothetical protein
MLRDILDEIVERLGPFVLKVLAAIAGLAVFVPLLIAFAAPLLG